jgi:UDP-glucose 4-epimerase
MRILITGALGHIGSKLLIDLQKNFTHKILLLDNLISQRYFSLFGTLKKNVFFFQKDSKNINEISNFLKKNDVIIHLSALTDATNSIKNKKQYLDNNYSSTKKVVDFCVKKKIKLIFISSTSVYGSQKEIVYEDDAENILNPQSPYAVSKIKEEKIIISLCRKKKLKAVILRFGTIFGISRGMRFHTAVNKFCFQSVKNEKLTIWKTAFKQKRPYLDLKDATRSIIFMIKNKIYDGQVYNVLTGNYTVKDIINNIKKYRKKLQFIYVYNKIMNQLSYQVSAEKIKNKGFKFTGNLNKGIRDTLSLFSKVNIY